MDTKISPSFWSDPEIETLGPSEKLAFLWIITNSQINICGYCQVSDRRFTFETGLPAEALYKTLKALPRALKHFEALKIIFVRNFIRHQLGDGEQLVRNNIFKSLVSVLQGITYQPLRDAIVDEYPIFLSVNSLQNSGRALKGLSACAKPLQGQREGEGEGEGERRGSGGNNPKARKHDIPSTVEEVIAYGRTVPPPNGPISEDRCRAFWSHYEGQAKESPNGEIFWVTSGDAVVTNWKAKLPMFAADSPKSRLNGRGNDADRGRSSSGQPPTGISGKELDDWIVQQAR